MKKSDVIALAGRGLGSGLLRPVAERFYRRRLPIVFYHGLWPVGSGKKKLFWGHDLEVFRAEVRALSQRFRFTSLDEVLALNETGTVQKEPVMAITFDDGHEMVRTGALAVLEDLGIRSTLFVITRAVGNGHLMWMHALNAIWQLRGPERLRRESTAVSERRRLGTPPDLLAGFPFTVKHWPMEDKDDIVADIWHAADMPPVSEYLDEHRPYFGWDELKSWIARGQSVGLHTATHPFSSHLRGAAIDREIVEPARQLKDRLGISRLSFAYPFGDRLASAELERQVCTAANLSCMLCVRGLSLVGTPRWQIERVDAEQGLQAHLYGRPFLNTALRRS